MWGIRLFPTWFPFTSYADHSEDVDTKVNPNGTEQELLMQGSS